MASARSLLMAFLGVVVLVEGGVVPDPPQNKIVGGGYIEISGAPWQVYLEIGEMMCGGSIISPEWVLSAAHCTYREPASVIRILVGTKSLQSGGRWYNVQQVFNHEYYDDNITLNDITVLKTTMKMDLVHPVRAVTLPNLGAKRPIRGKKLRVSGWGRIENNQKTTLLKAVDVHVQDIDECRSYYPVDEPTQICAGLPDKSFCGGDSGGPLVDGTLLVGIVSYMAPETCALRAGVYTDVAVYRQWIKTRTGV